MNRFDFKGWIKDDKAVELIIGLLEKRTWDYIKIKKVTAGIDEGKWKMEAVEY